MAADDKAKPGNEKRYLFRRCPTCGAKIHVCAFLCWKCGKRYNYNANTNQWQDDGCFGSANSNDALYNAMLCDVEKCFTCRNTQMGKPCKHLSCYGSGKGDCKLCRHTDEIRHDCCMAIVKHDKALENNKAKEKEYFAEQKQKLYYSITPNTQKEEHIA